MRYNDDDTGTINIKAVYLNKQGNILKNIKVLPNFWQTVGILDKYFACVVFFRLEKNN